MCGCQRVEEHGFNTVATLQATRGAAIGCGWNLGIMLAVGGKAHDVVPVKIS